MDKERVALFVDGANMFYAQRKLGWQIDYAKVYQHFTDKKEAYNAFYYTGIKGPKSDNTFIQKLTFLGYTVRTKEVKKIRKEEGQTDEKCNLDIEIAIDMFNTADNYDKAIIFSGDSDFERAIELLRSKGKKIVVVSTRGMIALELINAADSYVDLKDVKAQLEKTCKEDAPPN